MCIYKKKCSLHSLFIDIVSAIWCSPHLFTYSRNFTFIHIHRLSRLFFSVLGRFFQTKRFLHKFQEKNITFFLVFVQSVWNYYTKRTQHSVTYKSNVSNNSVAHCVLLMKRIWNEFCQISVFLSSTGITWNRLKQEYRTSFSLFLLSFLFSFLFPHFSNALTDFATIPFSHALAPSLIYRWVHTSNFISFKSVFCIHAIWIVTFVIISVPMTSWDRKWNCHKEWEQIPTAT